VKKGEQVAEGIFRHGQQGADAFGVSKWDCAGRRDIACGKGGAPCIQSTMPVMGKRRRI